MHPNLPIDEPAHNERSMYRPIHIVARFDSYALWRSMHDIFLKFVYEFGFIRLLAIHSLICVCMYVYMYVCVG